MGSGEPPRHHDTATSLFNLGKLLQEMGRSDEARPLFERELVACVRCNSIRLMELGSTPACSPSC
ncbi:MAG: tetratricopeptide repeat protein [Chloroflexaceae bacterium]|nr:tetratricopeptide repeat protein [Chloroflexaceae bacterium]